MASCTSFARLSATLALLTLPAATCDPASATLIEASPLALWMVAAELSMSLTRTVSEKSKLTRLVLRSSRKAMISGAVASAWYEVA
jgi:hypothetical protein